MSVDRVTVRFPGKVARRFASPFGVDRRRWLRESDTVKDRSLGSATLKDVSGPYRQPGAREPDEPPIDPARPWLLQTWTSRRICPVCSVALRCTKGRLSCRRMRALRGRLALEGRRRADVRGAPPHARRSLRSRCRTRRSRTSKKRFARVPTASVRSIGSPHRAASSSIDARPTAPGSTRTSSLVSSTPTFEAKARDRRRRSTLRSARWSAPVS